MDSKEIRAMLAHAMIFQSRCDTKTYFAKNKIFKMYLAIGKPFHNPVDKILRERKKRENNP